MIWTSWVMVLYMDAICLGRGALPSEEDNLVHYYSRQTQIFEKDAAAAQKFFPLELKGHGTTETAAWTGLASVLLNLDEFITRE